MPPKIKDNTSSAPNAPGTRSSRRGLQVDKAESPRAIPPHTTATQTQNPGYYQPTGGVQRIPDLIQLPPLLPSPNASTPYTTTGPRSAPLARMISPITQDLSPQGASHSPYTPSSGRQGYFPPLERHPTGHNTPISPAGAGTISRNTQPDPSIPLKRPHDGLSYR
jgi:hypothetical protein